MMDPDTLRQMIKIGMSAGEIAADTGYDRRAILRFAQSRKLGPWKSARTADARPLPDDFHKIAPTLTRRQCQAYYACGTVTLARWYTQSGIAPFVPAPKPKPEPKPRPVIIAKPTPPPRPQRKKIVNGPPAPPTYYHRDMTPEGQAADMLQADRYAVFRCNENGHPSIGGKWWIVGKRMVSKAELFERAERAANRMGRAVTWGRPRTYANP